MLNGLDLTLDSEVLRMLPDHVMYVKVTKFSNDLKDDLYLRSTFSSVIFCLIKCS
jgi:hypothetical protein